MIARATRISGTQPYYFATKLAEIRTMQADGHDIINLGIGSPDLLPPPGVIETLSQAALLPDAHGYQPYRGIAELRRAWAQWYQRWYDVSLDADTEVLPLMGSKEGLMHICMAFVEHGDRVLLPDPGYPAYRSIAELAGAGISYYRLKASTGYLPDIAKLDTSAKVMLLGYPHMPTGATATVSQLQVVVDWAVEHDVLLVHDNPYSHILTTTPTSLLQCSGAMSTCLELSSLSKNFNMAGWRVGSISGHATYIDAILTFKSNMDSGMYKPIQEAAITALQTAPEWLEQQSDEYRQRQEIAYKLLDHLDCTYTSGQAGLFVWARVPIGTTGMELSELLLHDKHIFVTPGSVFGSEGEHYIRVSLCSSQERLREAVLRVQKPIA